MILFRNINIDAVLILQEIGTIVFKFLDSFPGNNPCGSLTCKEIFLFKMDSLWGGDQELPSFACDVVDEVINLAKMEELLEQYRYSFFSMNPGEPLASTGYHFVQIMGGELEFYVVCKEVIAVEE